MDNYRNEITPNQQNKDLISSNDTNVLSGIYSDKLHSLLDEKNNIQNELASLRDKILALEKRKTDIDIEIQRISAANINQYLEEEDDDAIDKETKVVGVRPKPLSIRGYDKIYWVLHKHIEALVNGFTMYSHPYTFYSHRIIAISYTFSYLGKEVLLVKNDKKNEKQMEEWRSIIDTCKKICEIENSGDREGYKKYLDFFLQKYSWPTYPEETFSGPDLYLKNESVYEDAYLLLNYLIRFNEQIRKIFNTNKDEFWRFISEDVLLDECKIDNIFVRYMEMIYMLQYHGYTLAIVPILDENIIYRPKRIAQNENIYSLYYYDEYVEDPQMVGTEESQSPSTSSYYSVSGGSTYVSAHYRSGHWRNGRYVKGGYVKGHYRR